ncbi:hypothetical protein FR483_n605L [Paramecium bursaria Chlorella virus FR483]|uniref:Uncharacterized protein n605L n=1 Tax=Paramecium bursaria Chlorella virus FR483 TaxID=399781 RepID=A7J7V9_PBCVF|nr:hypothetical protein FR483_n605L [Paramecium bursaria Chlorella virus FR483]ABT15890.1 hypothetical protein FR483_n605L [Paramecium bursaria Chlorella virus FR483]
MIGGRGEGGVSSSTTLAVRTRAAASAATVENKMISPVFISAISTYIFGVNLTYQLSRRASTAATTMLTRDFWSLE